MSPSLSLSSVLSLTNIILKGGTHYLIIFLISQYLTLEQLGEYKAYFNLSILIWIVCKLGMDQTFYRWASNSWDETTTCSVRKLILNMRLAISALLFISIVVIGFNTTNFFIWACTTNHLFKSFYTDAYFPAVRYVQNSVKINIIYFVSLLLVTVLTLSYQSKHLLVNLAIYETLFFLCILLIFQSHFERNIDWSKIKIILNTDQKIKNFALYTFIASVGSINTYKLVEVYLIGRNVNFTLGGEFVVVSVLAALALSVSPANIVRPIVLPFLKIKRNSSKYLNKIYYANLLYSGIILFILSLDIIILELGEFFNLGKSIQDAIPIIILGNFFLAQIAFMAIVLINEGQLGITMFGVLLTVVSFLIGPTLLTEYELKIFLSMPAVLSGLLLIAYSLVIYMMDYKLIAIKVLVSSLIATIYVLAQI